MLHAENELLFWPCSPERHIAKQKRFESLRCPRRRAQDAHAAPGMPHCNHLGYFQTIHDIQEHPAAIVQIPVGFRNLPAIPMQGHIRKDECPVADSCYLVLPEPVIEVDTMKHDEWSTVIISGSPVDRYLAKSGWYE